MASAVGLCVLAAGPLLGASSLLLGWSRGGMEMMHRVHDVSWGAFAVVLVSVPAASQLRRPERRPAPMQQVFGCLAAGGLSMAASRAFAPPHVIRGLSLAVPATVMLVLHPARREIFHLGRLSFTLGALSLGASAPLLWYALQEIRIQRVDTISPHGVAFHWGTMATLALAIAATMAIASFRGAGWRIPAWCAGLALAIFGAVSLVYPGYASSVGRGWGAAAIVYSILFVATAERQLRAPGRSSQGVDIGADTATDRARSEGAQSA